MKRFLAFGCLLVALVMSGCSAETIDEEKLAKAVYDYSMAQAKEQESQAAQDLEVLEHEIYHGEYSSYIQGRVKNNSDYIYDYVYVYFNEYDKSGDLIGNSASSVNCLKPGESWKFSCYMDEKADTYTLIKVTGNRQ